MQIYKIYIHIYRGQCICLQLICLFPPRTSSKWKKQLSTVLLYHCVVDGLGPVFTVSDRTKWNWYLYHVTYFVPSFELCPTSSFMISFRIFKQNSSPELVSGNTQEIHWMAITAYQKGDLSCNSLELDYIDLVELVWATSWSTHVGSN